MGDIMHKGNINGDNGNTRWIAGPRRRTQHGQGPLGPAPDVI